MAAAVDAASFPRIPGARAPRGNLEPPRLDLGSRLESEGVIDKQPPGLGAAFVTLVPAPDADGNDLGGIRLPEVAVPLGTSTGWNLRPAAMGRKGSSRAGAGQRHPSQADDVRRVAAAAEGLPQQGYLVDEDARALVERARGLPWPPPLQ